MIVTVASGKGGTGKTTVTVSLALSLTAEQQGLADQKPLDKESGNPTRALFLDCDVEEPNAALWLSHRGG